MAKRYLSTTLTAKDLASPVFKKTSKAIAGLGSIAAAVGAVQLGRQLVRGLEQAVQASARYESASVRLAVALANQGENTKSNRDDLRGYAQQLSRVSLATETQILSSLAQAKSLGASSDAAKALTAAATDLASATGVDMDTAFRQVNRTLGGYAGELGELFPQLKELTAEQLRAGEAAKVLAGLVGGAGAAGARTFEGALNNLNSELERLRVTVGGPIREVLSVFINQLTGGVGDVNDALESTEAYRQGVLLLGAALTLVTENIALQAQSLARLAAVIETVRAISTGGAIDIVESNTIKSLNAMNTILGEIVARSQAARTAIVEMSQSTPDPGAGIGGGEIIPGSGVPDNSEALQRNLDNQLAFLQARQDATQQFSEEWLELEEERLRTQFEREIELAEQLGADKLLISAKYGQLITNAQDKFLTMQEKREKASADYKRQLAFTVANQVLATYGAIFGQNKAFAYANAVINTAQGVTKALAEYPPPVSFVMAGLVAAAGVAEIATISSARPQGFLEGGIIPGVDQGRRDSVLFAGRPGEAVLPKELTDFLLEAAGQRTGGPVEIMIHADLPILVEQLNTAQRSGEVRLVASQLGSPRSRQ